MQEYNAGDKAGAVKALEYAAQQGHTLARWKLGRMYADGDGVPQDDLKAFEHFSRIADESPDESPNSRMPASSRAPSWRSAPTSSRASRRPT